MSVYVRTEPGQQAAYACVSALPRKLRSILKLIDGKTELHVFEQNLQSFGDVKSIFHGLTEAGLIRPLPENARHVKVNMNRTAAELQPLMVPTHAADWMVTRSFRAESFQPAHTAADSQQTAQHVRYSGSQGVQAGEKRAAALKAITDDMAGFVLTHLPEQSFFLLKEIEDITSIEMLAVMLGGYTQMVSHLGQASDVHLASIRQALRENM